MIWFPYWGFLSFSLSCFPAKDPKRKTLSKELEEQENVLKHSIEKFKVVEANRIVLVSQLREALNEQVFCYVLDF